MSLIKKIIWFVYYVGRGVPRLMRSSRRDPPVRDSGICAREMARRERLMAHDATCMWDPCHCEENTTEAKSRTTADEPEAPKGEQGIH